MGDPALGGGGRPAVAGDKVAAVVRSCTPSAAGPAVGFVSDHTDAPQRQGTRVIDAAAHAGAALIAGLFLRGGGGVGADNPPAGDGQIPDAHGSAGSDAKYAPFLSGVDDRLVSAFACDPNIFRDRQAVLGECAFAEENSVPVLGRFQGRREACAVL